MSKTYYKKIMQYFAYALYKEEDEKRANKLLKEDTIKELEMSILDKKDKMNKDEFIFKAGMTFGRVLDSICECNDGIDKSIMFGLIDFEYLIGLKPENNKCQLELLFMTKS